MVKKAQQGKLKYTFSSEDSFPVILRPYYNHSVSFKVKTTIGQRASLMEKAGFNVFYYPSKYLSGVDFLSDSGTTTMTDRQWASLHLGDEAYGSNQGYYLLMEKIREIFGEMFVPGDTKKIPNFFIFHQGRPAEHALFSVLGRLGKGLIIPSNGHFDTTHANIEANGIKPVNLFSSKLKDRTSDYPFKGNMDTDKLINLITKYRVRIPLVYLTITNNTGGGQPVSLINIREVSAICRKNKIPLFLDACRFAENAYFICKKEKGYAGKSITEITREMFSYADGFTISFKKDGLVNMGGGLFLNREGQFVKNFPDLPDQILNHQIVTEGHPTYGGMSGRDIMALVEGFTTVVNQEYLKYRIDQVAYFGDLLRDKGIPVVYPFGGHAVYVDMDGFYKDLKVKPEDFRGIAFTALLLIHYGHRACELGNFAFGAVDSKTGKDIFPKNNFVRFAIPRLRYESQDFEHAAYSVEALYKNRDRIPKAKIIYGRDLPLRHFKARFKLI